MVEEGDSDCHQMKQYQPLLFPLILWQP